MNKKKLLKPAIMLVAASIVLFYILSLNKYHAVKFDYSPQMLVVSLCPLLWYCLSECIGKINICRPFVADFAIFNIIAVGVIFFTQEVLFKRPFVSADVTTELYMYITAVTAFVLHTKLKRKYLPNACDFVIMALIVMLVIGVWVIFEERMSEITISLESGKNVTDADGEYVNWISHRISMFDVFLSGNFSSVNPHRIDLITKNCPLAVMMAEGRRYVFPAILCMYCVFALLVVRYAKGCKNALVAIVAVSFVLQIVIGTVSNIFLIFSTSAGFPFIRTMFDFLPLGISLFATSMKQ